MNLWGDAKTNSREERSITELLRGRKEVLQNSHLRESCKFIIAFQKQTIQTVTMVHRKNKCMKKSKNAMFLQPSARGQRKCGNGTWMHFPQNKIIDRSDRTSWSEVVEIEMTKTLKASLCQLSLHYLYKGAKSLDYGGTGKNVSIVDGVSTILDSARVSSCRNYATKFLDKFSPFDKCSAMLYTSPQGYLKCLKLSA